LPFSLVCICFNVCTVLVHFLSYNLYNLILSIPVWKSFLLIPIEGKAVFITGCDSGFGLLTAKILRTRGCRVYANCITEEGVAQLKQAGCFPMKFDVRDNSAVVAAAEHIMNQEPQGLFAVISNAGVNQNSPFESISVEDSLSMVDVNLGGVIRVAHAFLPLLRRYGSGARWICVSSILGRFGLPSQVVYSASKHGVSGFCEALRKEVAGFGISVCVVEPGPCRTPLIRSMFESSKRFYDKAPEDIIKIYGPNYFGVVLDGAEKFQKLADTSFDDPIVVVNQLVQNVEARWPVMRRVTGLIGLVLMLTGTLPSSVQDMLDRISGNIIRPVHAPRSRF